MSDEEAISKERIAAELLWPLWRGIPADYKAKYARNIWEQFENNIRSAAYTGQVATFYDNICRRLAISPRSEDSAALAVILQSGEDRTILKALREETGYLSLLVRIRNDERKAAYEQQQEELF